jgi:4-hydroxy-4-methyl-2-oxoglutarate aldolase
MKRLVLTAAPLLAALVWTAPAHAQLGLFNDDMRRAITRDWKGERFPDGRPRVSDEVLQRMKTVSAEEAWGTLRGAGYRLQFEPGWKTINVEWGGERLVGRAVTAVFLPLRPDVNNFVNDQAKQEGRVSRGQNSWVIDTLVKDDVMVVDLFGKIKDGTIIGDNLGTSIMTKTGTGLVVDGGVRDVTGLMEIKGLKVFARDFDPSALAEATLAGINVPIRIGGVTVLPGDIVISDPSGITFVPAHLAEKVADDSELTQLRDRWGHQMLREQKYTPGEIDTQWTPAMIAEFNKWAEAQGSKMRMKPRPNR